jgi:hypothetical protein
MGRHSTTEVPNANPLRQFHPKRRGNPQWSSGVIAPVQRRATEFERVVERLKLEPDEYIGSQELRDWAEKNKDARFVPERLLKAWNLSLRGTIDDIG